MRGGCVTRRRRSKVEVQLGAFDHQIRKAALYAARQWPGVISSDDCYQEIYCRFLATPGSVLKLRGMDEGAQLRVFYRAANQVASIERKSYAYYKGSYRYSVREVRDLLSAGGLMGYEMDPDVQSFTESDKPKHGASRPPVNVELLDLRAGFSQLRERNPCYADSLVEKYLLDGPSADRSTAARAVEALVWEMNRTNRTNHCTRDDGPGTRKPISREAAQSISRRQWDDTRPVYPSQHRTNATEREVWE